ncbi:ras-related and estrogen-regulated growth inhibitor-like [Liolophura sinensis]|uniref:ras-related and estrogen-regulated growth inhibitor-like n=1 Tax=Liolophura sinensis TaxID=3198878 RepID=UPI003158A706
MSGPGTESGTGTTLRPYLRRKKSSLGETKVAMVGMDGVGKSAIAVRFLTRRFIGEYDQTSESKYKYTTVVDGESVSFEILDTRSTDGDHGARDDVIRWADGFMLIYSVTSRKSFDALHDIKRRIEEGKKATHVPMVVLGNKSDMTHVRQVTNDEGARLGADFACPFLELSASEDVVKVVEAFHSLCREVVEYKRRSRTFLDRVFGLKKS